MESSGLAGFGLASAVEGRWKMEEMPTSLLTLQSSFLSPHSSPPCRRARACWFFNSIVRVRNSVQHTGERRSHHAGSRETVTCVPILPR